MRRAGAVAVILTLLVLLTGCDGLRTKAPAQAQRYAPLPERSPEQAAYELLDALLLSPVTVALPPGFTAPAPRDGIGAFRPQTFEPASRALAGVIVSVKGPDALDQVALAVWATAVEAEADFAAVLAYDAPPLTGRFTPAGLGVPSTCVTAAPSDTGYGGWSNCQALVGSVRVYGITRSRDDEHALALVRAGMAHLQAVQAAMVRTAATPPTTKTVRVGVLSNVAWWFIPQTLGAFHERLAERGWVRGQNLAIEYRFSDSRPERLPDLAAELVRERVDVIFVTDPITAGRAAKDATSTIPIVFLVGLFDPVQEGLIGSLSRPGGNITGVVYPSSPGLAAKRLELLNEAVPSIRRVAVLVETTSGPVSGELEQTARARGVQLVPLEVRRRSELKGALAVGTDAGAQAILLADSSGSFGLEAGTVIGTFASQHGIPVVYGGYILPGLLAYGLSGRAGWARGAEYVDLVLRGAKPAETLVDLVKEYDLHVNLFNAQQLELPVAPSVLGRATEVTPAEGGPPVRAR